MKSMTRLYLPDSTHQYMIPISVKSDEKATGLSGLLKFMKLSVSGFDDIIEMPLIGEFNYGVIKKNILYIDLSNTKAISNLFLEGNPLPEKTIVDLINSSEFNIESNLDNGLIKRKENFYCITGIQKHIDKEYIERDVFIEKLLEYISSSSDYFNFIVIDLGEADASNLKSTLYDVVNELWVITEMSLPHTSKLKTFYSLLKRAGLKDKTSFVINRFDSKNAISISDATSILNMNDDEKKLFNEMKIPNDYEDLGSCWNYCKLASEHAKNSIFVKKLDSILENKGFYKKEKKSETKSSLFSFFKKSK